MTVKSSSSPAVALPVAAVRKATGSTLAERAFHAIAMQILTGVHAQGARLREAELIAELGMSRTPIREAIQRLELIGLVEASPSRFTVITSVTQEKAAETREFAALYAGSIARLAAGRLDDAAREAAVALTEAAIAGAASPEERLRTQLALFGFLMDHTGNELLGTLLGDSWYLILRNLRARTAAEDDPRRCAEALPRLAAALRTGDPDEAERAARAVFAGV